MYLIHHGCQIGTRENFHCFSKVLDPALPQNDSRWALILLILLKKKKLAQISKEAETGIGQSDNVESSSPKMGTSSIWNQELSSIFAPAEEPEVSEVVETTEETVITDFHPSTIKVDLEDDAAEEVRINLEQCLNFQF